MTFGAIFLASLLGSLHCAGMCGGLVVAVLGTDSPKLSASLAYHSLRGLLYVLFGVVAGAIGLTIDDLGSLIGLQRLAAYLTGALLVFMGVRALVLKRSPFLTEVDERSLLYRFSTALRRSVFKSFGQSPVANGAALGIATAFLPCSWLYSFIAVATATGSPLQGIFVMLAFWLGTIPVLASIGSLGHALSLRFRQVFPVATAVVLILAGIFSLSGRAEAIIGAPNHPKEHSHACH